MKLPETVKKLTGVQVLEQIRRAGLQNYGVYPVLMDEIVKNAVKYRKNFTKELTVTAALNNNDFSHVLLEYLMKEPEKIFEGMSILGYAAGADRLILQLPEESEYLTAQLDEILREYEISVEFGMVDMRKNRDQIVVHIMAAADISDLFQNEKKEGVWLSIRRKDSCSELRFYPYGTTFRQIIGLEEEVQYITLGQQVYKEEELDLAIDAKTNLYDAVVTVYPKDSCVLQETEKRLLQYRRESCGKCTFCREGLIQLHRMLADTTGGRGRKEYLELIREIGSAMRYSTQCSIGCQGADVVLQTLEKFPSEYEDHIVKHKCRTEVCEAFASMYIDPVKCSGCMECMDVCEAGAIEGKSGYIHMLDEFECTKCGKCTDVCEEGAIVHTTGRVPKLPTKLTRCGRFKKR